MRIFFLSTIFVTGLCTVVFGSANANADGSKLGDGADEASGRIVGGKKISIDKIPHQVFISTVTTCRKGFCNFLNCGGSIIHPRFILTAAHCFFRDHPMASVNPDQSDVRLHGPNSTVRVGSSFSAQGGIEIQGQRNVVHWKYHTSRDIDVALLMLDKPIIWGSNGKAPQMIQIPTESEFQRKWDKGPCWVSGWGRTAQSGYWQRWVDPEANVVDRQRFGEPKAEPELLQAELNPIHFQNCSDIYRDFTDPAHKDWEAAINEKHKEITNDVVCAYGQGQRDVCLGDSGGPLTCFEKKSGNPMLYGSVRGGFGCASGLPGFYMRVPKLKVWINQFINKYLPKNATDTP